jgi:hypothetical protein
LPKHRKRNGSEAHMAEAFATLHVPLDRNAIVTSLELAEASGG